MNDIEQNDPLSALRIAGASCNYANVDLFIMTNIPL
jgi:hypothetical protein